MAHKSGAEKEEEEQEVDGMHVEKIPPVLGVCDRDGEKKTPTPEGGCPVR